MVLLIRNPQIIADSLLVQPAVNFIERPPVQTRYLPIVQVNKVQITAKEMIPVLMGQDFGIGR